MKTKPYPKPSKFWRRKGYSGEHQKHGSTSTWGKKPKTPKKTWYVKTKKTASS
jgi:hypothetical protein